MKVLGAYLALARPQRPTSRPGEATRRFIVQPASAPDQRASQRPVTSLRRQ
jgi:hypothetical protein